MKNYFVGDNVVFKYLQEFKTTPAILYDFKSWSCPKELFIADNVIIQLDTLKSGQELFSNIKNTLPITVLLSPKVINYILLGILPFEYYENKFAIPRTGVKYSMLPLRNKLNLVTNNSIKPAQKRELKIWKPYFDSINLKDRLDHALNEHPNWFTHSDLRKYQSARNKLL